MVANDQCCVRAVAMLAPNLAQTLIALDFDGTIAPIVTDPARARPARGAAEVLRTLVGNGARVAIISGRDASTVVGLSGPGDLPGLIVEGLYGAEQWRAGQLTTLATPAAVERLRSAIGAVIASSPQSSGMWIEDKRLSLVVHARRATDPRAALAAVDGAIRSLAGAQGFEVHTGRDVLELRLPGFDKGSALRRVAAAAGRTHLLFAGDDIGDVPAFEALADLRSAGLRAWGIVVASTEVPDLVAHGDFAVDGPAGLVQLLVQIAGNAR